MARPLSGMSQVWSLFLSQVSLLLFRTIHSLQGLARNMVDLADFLPLSFAGDVVYSFVVVVVQGPNIRATWYNDISAKTFLYSNHVYAIILTDNGCSCVSIKKTLMHQSEWSDIVRLIKSFECSLVQCWGWVTVYYIGYYCLRASDIYVGLLDIVLGLYGDHSSIFISMRSYLHPSSTLVEWNWYEVSWHSDGIVWWSLKLIQEHEALFAPIIYTCDKSLIFLDGNRWSPVRLKKNMLHMTYECVLRYTQDHISCG